MASSTIRITLAQNANQTNKSVVLIRTADPDAIIPSLFDMAKKKLRMKKPIRLFLQDGQDVPTDDSLLLVNDILILVSAGEDYVGNAKKLSSPSSSSSPSTIHVIASLSHVEPAAIKQLETTARLPGIVAAVGMPDLHPGNKFPIGATFVSKGVIYPPLIGGDIGCGMALRRTSIPCTADAKSLASKIRGIEGPWDGDVRAFLDHAGVRGEPAFDPSLGTIGGGNHFAELQTIEIVKDQEIFDALVGSSAVDSLFLLVHSGSRGLGQHILSTQPLSLEERTAEFDEYIHRHDDACAWARCNRDLIAHRILSLVDPSWNGPSESSGKILDIWHNNVEKHDWSSSSPDESEESPAWFHRKGAAPSDKGLVVIPGSRGAMSYLVLPVGPQHNNAYSLAHGAGRILTRAKALGNLSRKYGSTSSSDLKSHSLNITSLASHVICEDRELLFEEAPEAYKEIEAVIQDLEEAGCIRVIAVLRPVVTYKVRSE